MRFILTVLAAGLAVACVVMPDRAFSATVEPTGEQIDSAPCTAALTAADDDKIIASCGALIGNDKAPKADRVKAAIARALAYDRKGEIERAIGDDDIALRLDPTQADVFNARGELLRRKGRPGACAFRFRDRDQTRPQSRQRKSQLQIAVAGGRAHRRDDGGQQQAELQLCGRQTPGRKGDLRQSRTGQSRPRDQRREYQGGPRGRPG